MSSCRDREWVVALGQLMPLAQPVPVATDVFLDLAVFLEHDRTRHDIIEELTVMTDDDERSGVFSQLLLEHFQGFDVEVIRGLVEN